MHIHYYLEREQRLKSFRTNTKTMLTQQHAFPEIERIGEIMAYEREKLHYKNVEIQTPLGIKKTTEIQDQLLLCSIYVPVYRCTWAFKLF
jgi:uracil phosphoribosyltransferase